MIFDFRFAICGWTIENRKSEIYNPESPRSLAPLLLCSPNSLIRSFSSFIRSDCSACHCEHIRYAQCKLREATLAPAVTHTCPGGYASARECRCLGNRRAHSSGGCQPILTQRRRASTITALFIFKAMTVARPMAVKPITCVPEAPQSK